MNVRAPAVAGGFYPLSKEQVTSQLRHLFGSFGIPYSKLHFRPRKDCFGLIVPHAGYDYSGPVAARVFADAPKADTVVILGPNHYGMGPDFSISDDDSWETPLGLIHVDKEFAKKLAERSSAKLDDMAHLREHSIEVQLPFLQAVMDHHFKIVPISVKHYAPDVGLLRACKELGKAIADVAQEEIAAKKKVLVVASTDFSHYEPQEKATRNDDLAARAIEKLDEAGLFKTVRENKISMCGYAAVAITIAACKALGAKKAERVAYMTSGDTTGDTAAVVGYGGLRIV